MKRSFYSLLILVVLLPSFLASQTITGKLVDQIGNGLSGLQLKLYISPKTYDATSSSNGSFTFSNITDVQKDDELPSGYAVSENYPNPFNPKTRIGITLPNSGSVRIGVYNLVGQKVLEEIERYYGAGINYFDLELNGLPNGFYLARITLDGKYSVTKKLMLMYGSQHLSSSGSINSSFSTLNKSTIGNNSTLDTRIDSLVVTGPSIAKKVFKNLPIMIGSSLNLGNLIITLPAPSLPSSKSPSNGETNVFPSITFLWDPSNGATSYSFQISTSSTFNSLFYTQSGLTNTNLLISGLNTNSTYYWRVNATNAYGTSGWSTVFFFKTVAPPQAPTLISPLNNASEIGLSPTLNWNAVSLAVSYTLQVSTSSSFSSFVYNQSGLTNNSQQLSSLNHTSTYYWRVSATNSYGTSGWSSVFSFKTLAHPIAPTLLSPQNSSQEISLSPTLSWNTLNNATSYTLQVSTSNSFGSFVYNQNGLTNTSQLISGLNIATTYYWRVNATNIYGTSGWSNVFYFKTVAPPQAPTLLSPPNTAKNISLSPTLSWNTLNNATSYTLQVSPSNLFASFVYNQSGLTNSSQQISGLSNVVTYYWRVSASNSYGTSGWSTAWSFTTPCGSPIIYSGKTYNTIEIGSQCWLKENLDVGTMILGNQNPSNNGTIEKYCYDNDPNNCSIYGGLYQWNEAMQYLKTEKAQGICPIGWHLPTNEECEILKTTVNNDGNALKLMGDGTGSGVGTNTSGFSALHTGFRYFDIIFFSIGNDTDFWSSTESFAEYAYRLGLLTYNSSISIAAVNKEYGYSVRCLKD